MAGAGYRVWTPGEVITADNVQQYLQDQSVQVYADSTARETALTGYLAEGMISYLQDSNSVSVYNGSSWVGLGGDAPIFTQGTSGQFLKSIGTAGVVWDSVPSPSAATESTLGLVYANTPTAGPIQGGGTYTDFGSASHGYLAYQLGNGIAQTAMGFKALQVAGTASQGNSAFGCRAGDQVSTGDFNTLIGFRSGDQLTTGNRNTFVGSQSGAVCSTGSDNVGVGSDAYSGNYNVGLGASVFGFVNTGNYNVGIGYGVGAGLSSNSTNSNTITIGANANPSTSSVSNQITLGDSNITSLRCAVQTISSLSDERDKTDIEDLSVGLSFVKQLRPVKFTWNSRIPEPIERPDGTTTQPNPGKIGIPDMGFIAQDLVAAEDSIEAHDYLQLTLRDNPDKLEASYGRLVPILVKAVQELSAEVESLKAQLAK